MKRNLESRVEVLVPIDDTAARQRLRAMLDLQLAPNRNAWTMRAEGGYAKSRADERDRGCQSALMDWLVVQHPSPAPRRKRRLPAPLQSLLAGADLACHALEDARQLAQRVRPGNDAVEGLGLELRRLHRCCCVGQGSDLLQVLELEIAQTLAGKRA